MKVRIFIITLWVMALSAVQGYAQRDNRGNTHSHTRSERVQRSTVHSRQTQMQHRSSAVSARPSQRAAVSGTRASSQRERVSGTRAPSQRAEVSGNRAPSHRERVSGTRAPSRATSQHRPPASHRPHMPAPTHYHHPRKPSFGHHYGGLHHHHHCCFNDWYWYTWGGYHNRFICHRLYHNRFFDNLLGYYVWGAIDAPTKLEIGNMTLTRYNDMLKIQIGNSISYLDLYRYQTVSYVAGYTSIKITTDNGRALIYFYDDYGNEAIYRL